MKKAKIMLLAIAVCATVGTALAFKVKSFGNTTYCYVTTESEPAVGECLSVTTNSEALPWTSGAKIFYTTKPSDKACSQVVCPLIARDFQE